MSIKIDMPDWEAVAHHYDKKGENDLNYLSAVDKRIVHHHSGIFEPDIDLLNRNYTEDQLLRILGESEDRLTHLGARVLRLEGSRGLDCGCGKGGSSFILARDYGHTMLGITISQTQLVYAREMAAAHNLQSQTTFEKKNIFAPGLNSSNTQFDFIWACESTEYMPDYHLLFRIWHELLNKEGKALVIAITYRESQLPIIKQELEQINRIYETRIGEFHTYFQAAFAAGFMLDDIVSLEEKIIPYYKLRLKSENRRGSEEALLNGLECGGLKYTLMLFKKN